MKNRTRIIILAGLVLVNVLFLFFSDKSAGVSFDEDLFVVADTAGIESVVIQTNDDEIIRLEDVASGWQLNDGYRADEGLTRVLLSILNRVQVKKPVDVAVPEEAIEVGVAGSEPMTFHVWGNPTKTRTFFSLEGSDEAYEVTIPGYNEYVGGIFELNPDQWRDRLVLNESWRTIQNLTLDYLQSEEKDFSIQFEDNFYTMEKVSEIDSSAVVDYLNQFKFFQTNEWISSGRFSKYDSLSKAPPLATLKMESINSDMPVVLDIYPQLPADPFYLLTNREGNMLVVDQRRVSEILKQPADFIFKKAQ